LRQATPSLIAEHSVQEEKNGYFTKTEDVSKTTPIHVLHVDDDHSMLEISKLLLMDHQTNQNDSKRTSNQIDSLQKSKLNFYKINKCV
jgi:hypothetical protein